MTRRPFARARVSMSGALQRYMHASVPTLVDKFRAFT